MENEIKVRLSMEAGDALRRVACPPLYWGKRTIEFVYLLLSLQLIGQISSA